MDKCLCGNRTESAALYFLVSFWALLPDASELIRKTEQSTNNSRETSKHNTGKTSFPPVLGIYSSTFSTACDITKNKFLPNTFSVMLIYYGGLSSLLQLCYTCVEALPRLVTLLFIRMRERRTSFMYTITSYVALIVQILPCSFCLLNYVIIF